MGNLASFCILTRHCVTRKALIVSACHKITSFFDNLEC